MAYAVPTRDLLSEAFGVQDDTAVYYIHCQGRALAVP